MLELIKVKYDQDIQADYYTKDAMAAVNLLNEIVH